MRSLVLLSIQILAVWRCGSGWRTGIVLEVDLIVRNREDEVLRSFANLFGRDIIDGIPSPVGFESSQFLD